MAILPASELADFLNMTDEEDLAAAISVRDSVEAWIQKYCSRTFESTTYTLEKYSGSGGKYLYLKNYPVIALYRIAVGTEDAIRIKNTATGTTASVSVTSTGIVLEKDGTADSTVLFATYTTMATVVSAINALGNSWVAVVADSSYNTFASSSLLKVFGQSCIDSNEVYLKMPDEALDDFEVNENNGMVYCGSGFPSGFNNIYVTYTAGYSEASMPEDLKYAVKLGVKQQYDRRDQEMWGVDSYTVGDITIKYSSGATSSKDAGTVPMPREAIEILARYRKIKV